MAPRSIALTEDENRTVDDLVRSGRFRDADEVVREGLRLVAEDGRDETFGYTLEELRAAVQVGLDDMAAGRYVEFENVDDLVGHLRQLGDDVINGKVEP